MSASISTLCSCFGFVENRDDKKLPLKQRSYQERLCDIEIQKQRTESMSFRKRKKDKKKHKWVEDRESSIVIIGAGQSGIHMASILIRYGFINVIIMEKDGIFGGKSVSIIDNKYNNIVHEMGSSYIHTNYDAVFELIGLYDDSNNELVPITNDNKCIINTNNNNKKISLDKWINGENKILIKEAAKKYINLHKQIFGDYENETDINLNTQFPPKPKNMADINMAFLVFIKKHKLDVLIPYFIYNQSLLEGYGNLDEIAAFYGLLWNNISSINILIDPTLQKRENLWMLKKGYQHLFENIINTEGIDIRYNVQITTINRYLNDSKHKICIMYNEKKDEFDDDGTEKLIECDVLFCASDMSLILPFISDITKEEESIFESITAHTLCTTLFECDADGVGTDVAEPDDAENNNKSIQFYPNNLKKAGHVFKIRNSSKILNGNGEHLKLMKDIKRERFVSYQMLNKDMSFIKENNFKFDEILLGDLEKYGMKNAEIVNQNIMRFCPHWNKHDINKGNPWFVRDKLQGKYKNMYYIGSAVSYQSIESVLEYNQYLQQKLQL